MWNQTSEQSDRHSVSERLLSALTVPFQITFLYPPVFLVLSFSVLYNGFVNIIFSTLGSLYQVYYSFSSSLSGLPYLGLGLGGIVGLAFGDKISTSAASFAARTSDSKRPEHNLLLLSLGFFLSSLGLVWFGWPLNKHAPWIVSALGLCFFGFGWQAYKVSPYIKTITVRWLLKLFTVINSIVPDRSMAA